MGLCVLLLLLLLNWGPANNCEGRSINSLAISFIFLCMLGESLHVPWLGLLCTSYTNSGVGNFHYNTGSQQNWLPLQVTMESHLKFWPQNSMSAKQLNMGGRGKMKSFSFSPTGREMSGEKAEKKWRYVNIFTYDLLYLLYNDGPLFPVGLPTPRCGRDWVTSPLLPISCPVRICQEQEGGPSYWQHGNITPIYTSITIEFLP